ncbi:hypothetical protein L0B52_01070 [Suttonella sp. R2A3]|uniref:Bug family tripartite tricarboxylate transporter substrate binding protein n=1 Tax=Suttonella sp. R2A3 TaxID=2908648 RepID=UPI001F3AF775|nr:tripartite tricarboxylate transporter substrate-binding protein [Suttonella sp. R2A3]UJF24759.1 hypothetical protein L0B52_01070 [Suttonella sp. R2A3]
MNKILCTLALATMSTSVFAADAPQIKECIAPADPGGGWDFTCRSVSKLLREEGYVNQNIQTVNMAGAGGGVAFAHVVSKRADDNGLFIAASTATTSRLAQKQFRGMDAGMVKWVGSLGADYGVIAVGKDSPYNSLNDLMDAVKANPRDVKFSGGSARGGWDHLKVLLTASDAGVEDLVSIPYLSFNNGAEAITQVIGGHLDGFSGDVSEIKGFIDSGDLKILAVLSEERLEAPFDQIPTAAEQGIDTIAPNWRGFYLPGNVDQATYDWWVNTLDELSETDAWHEVMQQNGLMTFTKTGAEFDAYVSKQIQDIHDISVDLGIIKE